MIRAPLRDRELSWRVRYEARQLADTGRYLNWRGVEAALKLKGRSGARKALANVLIRFALDMRCAHAQRKRDNED